MEHINSIWNKEEMPQQWKESIVAPIYIVGDEADCSNIFWAVTPCVDVVGYKLFGGPCSLLLNSYKLHTKF
jgi:hypothetical protein